jgi:hypothetical protein
VRFPYTFFSLGLVLLESVSVFALNGQLLTASSSGGGSAGGGSNTSRMSLWRSPLPAAPVAVGGADAVRIMQRAEFDVLTVTAGDVEGMRARLPGPGAADDAQSLTATLAAAHFTASAAPPRTPGMMWSL